MKRFTLIFSIVMAVAVTSVANMADAGENGRYRRAQRYCWHSGYYNTQWGAPTALVVPPTAGYITEYGWGVTNTRIRRIDHQFYRNAPTMQGFGGATPMPHWPSDTTQMGYYPVRGPW